jgi:hypothetical protein
MYSVPRHPICASLTLCLFLSFLSLSYGLSFSFLAGKLFTCNLASEISRNSLFLYFASFFISCGYSLSLFIAHDLLTLLFCLFVVRIPRANSPDSYGAKKQCLALFFSWVVQIHSLSTLSLLLLMNNRLF